MTTHKNGQKTVRFCNFCEKSQKEVLKIIEEDRRDLHICNECIDLCVDIIEEQTSFNLEVTEIPARSMYHFPSSMTEDDKFFWTMI